MLEDLLNKCYDCSKLKGKRLQSICEGTSGLSFTKQAGYLQLWLEQGLITESECSDGTLLNSSKESINWTVSKPSRGLGDTIAKITSAVGIKPCGGCKQRQEKLNNLLSYKKKKSTDGVVANKKNGSPFAMSNKENVRFISSQQLQIDIKTLISKIPSDVTAIAGIARSGLSVATMVSMYLHLPLIIIRQTSNDVIDGGNGWRLGGNKHINPNKDKVLVIDDTVMTGNSFKVIKPLAKKHFKNVIFGAVYVNPFAHTKPDIWAIDLPWPHILEWNVFNSVLTPSCCTDFDGILCLNCPFGSDDDGPKYLDFINNAKPLYITRRNPIPLIVTARIEKYREPTENWLKKHGIQWEKLIMHPAKTLQERERDNIPLFKYNNFKQWADKHVSRMKPLIFFESEDWQAKAMGKLNTINKGIIICPNSGNVY